MNKKIHITKLFSFEAAHALFMHDGLCKNLHGHSYKLFVTVSGFPINDIKSPKNGMVMDYGELKNIVEEQIIHKFDHCLMIYSASPQNELSELLEGKGIGDKIIKLSYPPTCEMMLLDFAEKIQNALPKNITLEKLKLYETATSYASWKKN